MRTFFALSGMLAVSAVAAPLAVFLTKRLLPLGLLLTFWATIRFFYFGFAQSNPARPSDGAHWTEIPRVWISPTSELWFLWALILYLIAARLLGRFHRPLVLAVTGGVSVLGMGGLVTVGGFGRQAALMMFPFFLFGLWYGADLARLAMRHAKMVALVAFPVYVTLYAVRPMVHFGPALGLVQIGLTLSGMAWFVVLMHHLAKVGPVARFLSRIGRNTLPIYFTHMMSIAAGVALLGGWMSGIPTMDYWASVIVAGIAVLVAFVLSASAQRVGLGWLVGLRKTKGRRSGNVTLATAETSAARHAGNAWPSIPSPLSADGWKQNRATEG